MNVRARKASAAAATATMALALLAAGTGTAGAATRTAVATARGGAPGPVTHLPAPHRGSARVTYADDHVLVRFRTGTSAATQARALSAAGTTVVDGDLRGGYVSVAAPAGATSQLGSLRRDPAVAWAGYDYVRQAFLSPNDPLYVGSYQEYLRTTVQMPAAWSRTTGSTSQVVAVVDTGVNAAHPDLAGRVLPGYDFVNGDTNAADDNGHGTMVAGIAAAGTNNGIGVAGVAWTARILPVKVLDSSGSGTDSTIAAGIRWAADHGATVINLSLGGPGSSAVLHDAIAYAVGKGIPVVVAAGNTGDSTPQYPAADPAAIAVGALSPSGAIASFSTYGDWVDVAAPGVGITSTYLTGYATGAGTSFAAPIVAGVAALVRTQHPTWSPAQVATRIELSANDVGPVGLDPYSGFGDVNAAAAVGAPRTSSLSVEAGADPEADTPNLARAFDPTQAYGLGMGDVDWFRTGATDPVAGDGWTFTVAPDAPSPGFDESLDPQLSVYDGSWHLLATSTTQVDAAGDVKASVVAPGGPLYVQVTNLNPGSSGYHVSGAVNGTTGTPTAAGPRAWVVDSTPAARAQDVPLATDPSLTLGRSMDASTLTGATVTLVDGITGATVPGNVSYVAGTGVLTFTPDAPLLNSLAYDLVVSGARDSLGNAMPQTRLPFASTDSGVQRPVTGLTAGGGTGTVTLAWTQPEMTSYYATTVWYAQGDVAPAWGSGTLAVSGFLDGATISGLDSTKDYSFSVFSERGGGGGSAATVTVKGTSDLLTVTPVSSVYLHPVTVTATLRDAGTLAPEPGRNAALYWRRAGTTAWTLITVALTDAQGRVTATVAPPWNAQFYLHDLAGQGRMGAALTVSHAVTFDVSARVSAARVTHGATVTLTGVVLPVRTGATVLLENYYGGAWHITASGTLNIHSAHAFPVTLRSAATYTFRFVKAGETLLGTGVSPPFTVTAV